jgi:parallel beta-helix repeat protein
MRREGGDEKSNTARGGLRRAVGLFSLGTSSGMGMRDRPACTVTVRPGRSIQAAIDAAEEGAVICLAEGSWEENLVIEKGLTLRGLGSGKSVIKGLRDGEPVLLIYSDAKIEATVEGLTLAEAKGWRCAERPLRCPNGLSLGGKVKATIRGNTISGNGYGISMRASAQASISGNTISGNRWDSISMEDSAQATIQGNTISGNRQHGIFMRDSAQATIQGNKITKNSGYGVWLYQRPCADTDRIFGGAVRGRVNEISGNEKGDVCPAELAFLMTEAGGCYGPKC